MIYEWDEQKAARNVFKHSVPFDYAARVFLDPYRLDGEDQRRDYSEERRIILGKIEGGFMRSPTPCAAKSFG